MSRFLRRVGSWTRAGLITLSVGLYSVATGLSAAAANPADLLAEASSNTAVTVDHSVWDKLLKAYVHESADGINRVDYAAFKKTGQAALKSYIASLQGVDLRTLSRPEQFAMLANLYNAKTIDIILDHYPVKSIKDISLGGGLLTAFTGGPWKSPVVKLSGVPLSLDDIEHGMLRPVFKDPRVHYAVNCASLGCPNLQTEAWTAAKLNAALDNAAKSYVNNRRGASVEGNGIEVSSIYHWFKADFGGNDAGVIAHLRKFAEPALAEKLKTAGTISGDRYDWSLNDTAVR